MRIPRDNDKLIAEGKLPHTARIYLDGALITHVHQVDDEEGWVKTLVYNNKGGAHLVVREGGILILFPGDEGYGPPSYGQDAFEAYNNDRGGVNFKGDKTPEWDKLPEGIRHAWEMGATAVINTFVDQDEAAHRLEAFFFDLLRDHIPAGTLYKIVKDMETHPPPYKYGDSFSGYLGNVAKHLAQRVLAVKDQNG